MFIVPSFNTGAARGSTAAWLRLGIRADFPGNLLTFACQGILAGSLLKFMNSLWTPFHPLRLFTGVLLLNLLLIQFTAPRKPLIAAAFQFRNLAAAQQGALLTLLSRCHRLFLRLAIGSRIIEEKNHGRRSC